MAIDDTGWKAPTVTMDNGAPVGTIAPATGLEQKPCFMCRSFEKDEKKLRQFLASHKLEMNAEGKYETPIVKDFNGRKSLKIDPRDFGYCRKDCIVVHMGATCGNWDLTQLRSDLAAKIR